MSDDEVENDTAADGEGDRGSVPDPSGVEAGPEVADVLPRGDDPLAETVEAALAGRAAVVAVGVPLRLLPAVLAARERSSGAPWWIACRPGVVDALSRALVLGTAVAEAIERDEIRIRTGESLDHGSGGTVLASPNSVDAVVGPRGDRSLATTAVDDDPETVDEVCEAAGSRFEAAAAEPVEMPSRTRLLAAAREVLDDRFADDLATLLESLEPGAFGRTTDITDRTLLVALAARHDHLFRDLRRWIGVDGVDIAPEQELTDDRRTLVDRELIESIKIPMGPGRPMYRLRAVDDALLRARPEEVPSILEGQFALPTDEDGRPRREASRKERRPVWERRRW
ncbi:DUF5821 family protein [Halorubrum sp. RMP-47]|uniref:DUF5821 family protein n=1 Tax=Halorubrum miltondacostae TaxID=3076378 RepID=A0ABD5M7A4_9EURY